MKRSGVKGDRSECQAVKVGAGEERRRAETLLCQEWSLICSFLVSETGRRVSICNFCLRKEKTHLQKRALRSVAHSAHSSLEGNLRVGAAGFLLEVTSSVSRFFREVRHPDKRAASLRVQVVFFGGKRKDDREDKPN